MSSHVEIGRGRRALARAVTVVALSALSTLLSCSHDSYLKVTLLSGDTPFSGVTEINVKVQGGTDGSSSAWLTYRSGEGLSFDAVMSKTLSIAFTPSHSGEVDLEVGVKDATGCVGRGLKRASIQKGNISAVTIWVNHATLCPSAPDAGVVDGGDGGNSDAVTFPGCDPAAAASEAMCSASQACFVNCFNQRGMCVAAGTRGPGESCGTNDNECMPGTQCFDYSGVPGCGPGTKICQRFCNGDGQCAASGSGGGGSGGSGVGGTGGNAGAGGAGGTTPPAGVVAACRNPVVCAGNLVTSYRTCSFACDPRGGGTLGCPNGLLCFLYRDLATGQDVPDCGCHTPTRTKVDGETCTSSAMCAPGHICNMMGGTQVCRRLCKMNAPGDCASPRTCGALQNNPLFGVCI